MIRILSALVLVGGLAACGADGEPVKPTANVGVNVSNNGVSVGTNLGVRKGPVGINVSIF